MTEYLTTTAAAVRLGVTRGYIRQLLIAGKLRGQKFGRAWMIDPASIIEYARLDHRPGPKPKGEKKGEAK